MCKCTVDVEEAKKKNERINIDNCVHLLELDRYMCRTLNLATSSYKF